MDNRYENLLNKLNKAEIVTYEGFFFNQTAYLVVLNLKRMLFTMLV